MSALFVITPSQEIKHASRRNLRKKQSRRPGFYEPLLERASRNGGRSSATLTATAGSQELAPPNRDHRQDADATIGCLTIRRRRGPDLIADFLNLGQAHLVQQRNDVAMNRHHFGANRHFDIRIGGVQLIEPRQNLIVLDKLPVEEDRVAGRNADGDVVLLLWCL